MSSSDSEDDCYGNVAQKLQSLKNKYTEDKVNCSKLLNYSKQFNEIIISNKKSESSSSGTLGTNASSKINVPSDAVDDQDEDVNLDIIIAEHSRKRLTRKRTTRNSKNAESTEEATAAKKTCTETTRSRGGRGRGKGRNLNCPTSDEPAMQPPSTSRQPMSHTGRSRGRRRNRTSIFNVLSQLLPTYSVGNTDEYYDNSDNQPLFNNSTKTDNVVIVEDVLEDPLIDDNEELSVKVYWQSSEIVKFLIRKYQKLTQIFDYFSARENITYDNLLFTYNDKILKADDTPDSIDYSIVKFIDGGVVNQSVSKLVAKHNEKIKDGIVIKFQCQNVKKPVEITVRPDEKMSLAMVKYAEHLEKPIDQLLFEFDGDCVSGKSTARELELEGGECIDVKFVS